MTNHLSLYHTAFSSSGYFLYNSIEQFCLKISIFSIKVSKYEVERKNNSQESKLEGKRIYFVMFSVVSWQMLALQLW